MGLGSTLFHTCHVILLLNLGFGTAPWLCSEVALGVIEGDLAVLRMEPGHPACKAGAQPTELPPDFIFISAAPHGSEQCIPELCPLGHLLVEDRVRSLRENRSLESDAGTQLP